MKDKSAKEEDLHDFDQWVGGHEKNSFPENLFMIFSNRDQKKVYSQVHDQENHQERPHQCHDEFLGQRGES